MLGKKSSERSEKNVFFIHTNIVTNKWGGKRGKQFFQKHKNSASTKCWGKNRRKKLRKNVFYIHTNIVPKNGGKNAQTIFPETHE